MILRSTKYERNLGACSWTYVLGIYLLFFGCDLVVFWVLRLVFG